MDTHSLRDSVNAVKSEIAVIAAKLDAGLPNLATKADLHKVETTLVKWMVGAIPGAASLAAAIVFGVARLYPPQPPQIAIQSPSQQAPILPKSVKP
ncbi:MAG: hypothetical protein WC091_16715 [Sulfuricellaceae bacterium]